MDDFKKICMYENLPISAYFFKRQEDFSCLKNSTNTFKLGKLYARLYLFIIDSLLAPVILTSIHPSINNSREIKVLMKVIKAETFNIGLTSQ